MIPPGALGILAHYFHRDGDRGAQGSVSESTWQEILDACGARLIGAQEWQEAFRRQRLGDAVCVTLDDGLVEQRLALAILADRRLTAFLNIYTGPLLDVPNMLETARWIRNEAFGSVETFYKVWQDAVGAIQAPVNYLRDYGYLTDEDRAFRYWRNVLATPQQYEATLFALAPGMARPAWAWFRPAELVELHRGGHVIGFHSHSHPTTFAALTDTQQYLEYATSRYVLTQVLSHAVDTMAHPCGVYTPSGLRWLREAGVRLGWGATMHEGGSLAWPRWSTGYWR